MKTRNAAPATFGVFENVNVEGSELERLYPDGPTSAEVLQSKALEFSTLDGRNFTLECRSGIFPELRGGVWTRCIFHKNCFAGTEAHVARLEDGWNRIVTEYLDLHNEIPPHIFGGSESRSCFLTDSGLKAQTRILTAVKQILAVDWCPTIVEIVPILLVHMSESTAYYIIEELWNRRPLHFAVTRIEAKAWSLAFSSLLDIFYPRLRKILFNCGALERKRLECIFHRIFIPLFRFEHAMQIWDAWFKEGSKIIFRFALGILYYFQKKIYALDLDVNEGSEFWNKIKSWTHEPEFDFEALKKTCFSVRTGMLKRPLTWDILEECTKSIREQPLLLNLSDDDSSKHVIVTTAAEPNLNRGVVQSRPTLLAPNAPEEISFYWPPLKLLPSSSGVLLKEIDMRAILVKWIPQVFRHKELKAVFSTEVNGGSLSHLYNLCNQTAPSLLIVEVAGTNELIGAYCSDPWHQSSTVYGSGQCFLFKLYPQSSVYKWKYCGDRRGSRLSTTALDNNSKHFLGTGADVEPEDPLIARPPTSDAHPFIHPLNHISSRGLSDGSKRGLSLKKIGNLSQHRFQRVQEMLPHTSRHQMASQRAATMAANESSFMFATPYYMGLGASTTNVSCALKIHEGLARGSSGPSLTFGNPCLVSNSEKGKAEFDISCVEVYGFF